MQRLVFPRYGDPSIIELEEVEELAPGPGEIRVAVEASGVNFADVMARRGL